MPSPNRKHTDKKYSDPTWDFRKANTKQDTHCYHPYPAVMIPQIAARLIATYGRSAKTLFDPYCGTGTSLVEANLKGIDGYGTDLNPLARLIAEIKTAKIPLGQLDNVLQKFADYCGALSGDLKNENLDLPNFSGIDFWFKPETVRRLSSLKRFITAIPNSKIRRFFLIAFSETVRESSLTRNGEFKLYRMNATQREGFNPDVIGIMRIKLKRNRAGLESYLQKMQGTSAKTIIYDFDSSQGIPAIKNQSIDLVVTSPPYGDSRTTVAYGQFSRLANQWLGVEHASQIDNQLMGGRAQTICETGFALLDETIQRVAAVDAKRARDVYSFYADYIKSIAHVAAVVKKNGYICYVVGNRRVKNIALPTDEITRAIFERNGLGYENTFIRSIPNKRMPSQNSPTNRAGHKGATMTREYIVVMKKRLFSSHTSAQSS